MSPAAVVNSTGDIFYSKVTDSDATPSNNILEATTSAWTKNTALTNSAVGTITVAASEAGPAKGVTAGKFTIAAADTTDGSSTPVLLAYKAISPTVDLTSYDSITFYLRADTAIASGALQFWVTSAVDGTAGTAVEKLALPAIPKTTLTADAATDTAADVDKWVRIVLRLTAPTTFTGGNKVGSVALYWAATDAAAQIILYYYQVRLMKSFPGRTNFSISETVDSIDVSDYQSLTAKEFASTYSTWTVTMDGHKEGSPPMDKGKEYVLGIWESDTVGQCFVGNAFYTSFTPSGSFNESVKYSYSFQGTGFLSKPLS